MKFYLEFIFILFYLKKCLNLEIDNFLTPPYQEMDFKDNDIGNIIFYFTTAVDKDKFSEIYLTNSTNKLPFYNKDGDQNYCTFKSTLVRCVLPKNKDSSMGDINNLDYKFYYSLKYILNDENQTQVNNGLVTVAINSGNFIKYVSFFFLFLIF